MIINEVSLGFGLIVGQKNQNFLIVGNFKLNDLSIQCENNLAASLMSMLHFLHMFKVSSHLI